VPFKARCRLVSDILEYFNACYGDTTGFLHIGVGRSPYLRNGTYAFSEFVQSHFAYPDEADRAAREILREATLHDVYVCPYLMWADKRAKGAAVARVLIHADVDGGLLDAAKVRAIGGFAVGSGTPGNGHAYVPLSESVIAPVHRALCRGLGSYLGAIDSKITDNDLLRPPGTFNYKPTLDGRDPAPVEWVVRP
jgi:hypothetical protein